jgi:hypothetical protein
VRIPITVLFFSNFPRSLVITFSGETAIREEFSMISLTSFVLYLHRFISARLLSTNPSLPPSMSPSVFEIVKLPMKDIIEQKPELYEECLKTLSQQSGLKNQWYAGTIEQPKVYYDFLGTYFTFRLMQCSNFIYTTYL